MVWTTHLQRDQGGSLPGHGFTSSPVVTGDAVLVQVGGKSRNSLVSFDAKTGKINWGVFVSQCVSVSVCVCVTSVCVMCACVMYVCMCDVRVMCVCVMCV